MTKVLWFSQHNLSAEQAAALEARLGDIEVTQVSKIITSASELAPEIADADVIAAVAPIGLLAEFLFLADDKPVLTAQMDMLLLIGAVDGGEDRIEMRFVKWERVKRIVVEKEDF